MKTAVSIPDALFERADSVAKELGKSRSELYRDALTAYLSRESPGSITEALNAVADDLSADHSGFIDEAGRQTLAESEW